MDLFNLTVRCMTIIIIDKHKESSTIVSGYVRIRENGATRYHVRKVSSRRVDLQSFHTICHRSSGLCLAGFLMFNVNTLIELQYQIKLYT